MILTRIVRPEKVKRTTWVEFVMNGARAEAFFKYADKGGTFYLEGELYDDTYNSKPAPMPVYDANMQPVMNAQGQQVYYNIVVERTTKKLRCRDWKFMDGKRQDNAYTGPAVAGAPVQAQAAPAQAPTYAPVAPPMAAPATPAAVAATFSAPAGMMAAPPQFAMPANNMPPGV